MVRPFLVNGRTLARLGASRCRYYACWSAFALALMFSIPCVAQIDAQTLWEHATLYRDEWGTPHVYGDTALAMAFALGYAQAEDRIQELLKAYRIANGRAAEVWGEPFAASDAFALSMGHAELVAENYGYADSTTIDLCEGFALGVNAWLAENADNVPPWTEGVRPEDILALLHCFLMSFAPYDYPDAYPGPLRARTGNAWALSPEITASGETILAINPHAFYDGPFQWYEAHLSTPELNVAGATLCGLPIVLMGHNDRLGWALTPNEPDFADVYIEPEISGPESTPTKYRFNVKPNQTQQLSLAMLLQANQRTYSVSTPAGMETRQVGHLITQRGPIFGQRNARMYSYRIGGYGRLGGLAQLYEMGRARDLAGFQQALSLQQLPCFHVTYGDKDGNLFYLYNATLGEKGISNSPLQTLPNGPVSWDAPLPGEATVLDWGPIIPVGFLPSVTNPESGFIQACGSPPWAATDGSSLTAEAWPSWFARDRDTFRAQRARYLLGLGELTFEDAQSMVYDAVVPMAVNVVPKLLNAATEHPEWVTKGDPDIEVGLDILRQWRFLSDVESEGMTFFHAWWLSLLRLSETRVRSEAELLQAIQNDVEGLREVEFQALGDAAKQLRNEFNSLSVPWGDAHVLQRGEQAEPAAGALSGEPILVSGDRVYNDGKWRSDYGYAFAMVVQFGDPVQAVSVVPFGASGDPDSPHYSDQAPLFSERRFKYTYFDASDVQEHAVSAKGRVLHLQAPNEEMRVIVRSDTAIEAVLKASPQQPAEAPEGLAAFTRFFYVEHKPATTTITVEIHVPMDMLEMREDCDEEPSICGYTEADGWIELERQRLDEVTKTLRAEGGLMNSYAVLGPEPCLRRRVARIIDQGIPKPKGYILQEANSSEDNGDQEPDIERRGSVAISSISRGRITEARSESIDSAELPDLGQTKKAREAEPPDRIPKDALVFGPGADNLKREISGEQPMVLRMSETKVTDQNDVKPGIDTSLPSLAPEKNTSPETTPNMTGATAPSPGLKPSVSIEPPSTTEGEPNVITSEPQPVARTDAATPDAAKSVSPPPGITVTTARPPATTRTDPGAANKAMSSVAWGKEVDLRPPKNEGLFHIESTMTVQARLVVFDLPPAPLPTGLAAFTYFMQPEQFPMNASVDVAISLNVPEDRVLAANIDKLRLYALDAKNNWSLVDGQKTNVENRSITALDAALRTYVILGPSEFLVKPPAPLKATSDKPQQG